MKRDTKGPRRIELTNPGEVVTIGRPDTELAKDAHEERITEEKRIQGLIAKVRVNETTVIPLTNHPAGRTAKNKYADNPIDPRGSQRAGGRFNYKPRGRGQHAHRVIYAADQKITALKECTGQLKPAMPYRYFPVNLKLQRVWDLRGDVNCKKNGINRSELLSTQWEYCQDVLMLPAYSQLIGNIAYEHDEIEAICYKSTAHQGGYCFAIFESKLLTNSLVQAFHPETKEIIVEKVGIRVLTISTH